MKRQHTMLKYGDQSSDLFCIKAFDCGENQPPAHTIRMIGCVSHENCLDDDPVFALQQRAKPTNISLEYRCSGPGSVPITREAFSRQPLRGASHRELIKGSLSYEASHWERECISDALPTTFNFTTTLVI
jgi:hypothetical protein